MFSTLPEKRMRFDRKSLAQFVRDQPVEELIWKSYLLSNLVAGIKEHIPPITTVIAGYNQPLLAAIVMGYQYDAMRAIQLDALGNIIHGTINRNDRIYIVDWDDDCIKQFNNYFTPIGACIIKQTCPRAVITIENVQYLIEL